MKENDCFDFSTFKDKVLQIVPIPPIDYILTKEHQNKKVEELKDQLGNRSFFFVTNLETFEIEERAGIEKWLGYNERDFSMKKYLEIIQRGNKKTLMMIALQLYESLCKGVIPLHSNMRFSSLIALKHYDRSFLLAHKISSPFQYDRKNRLTAHLDQFSIIGKYNGEALSPDFFNITGSSEEERGAQIMNKTRDFFLKIKVFSEREVEIIEMMSLKKTCTQQALAELLGVSINTAKTHSRSILTKAKNFFDKKFTSVVEVVEYLKRERLM